MFRRKRIRKAKRRNQQRRRPRLVPIAVFVLIVFALAWFAEQQATTTLIFVRHTDSDTSVEIDPPLNRIGRERAELLADVVEDIDVVAGVDAVYASEHRRTQETAAAVAERLDLDVSIRDPYEVVPFMADVLREHKGEIVLVVTLGDALAPLVEELHGSKNIPLFDPNDHDDIFIVTIPWFGKVKTLQFHYGFYEPPGPKLPGHFSSSDDVL